ncbi:MAG TPA: alkaline phosphatase family protein [Verrucomicrobiae bacterium]|nr:alkaline phosphatase family protein [Verrucomicrobiae bacterium]
MILKHVGSIALRCVRFGVTSIALFQFTIGASLAAPIPPQRSNDNNTRTPIKHVIVIIGENRSFDHVFATYVPRNGQTVHNLLSEGIIELDQNKNAIPGPNFEKARQLSASDQGNQDPFLLSPPKHEFPGNVLPAPEAGGPSGVNGYFSGSNPCHTPKGQTPLTPVECAQVTESGLDPAYYSSLASGGTGQYSYTPDVRIANFDALPAGPFQLTNGTKTPTPGYSMTYTDYAASPVHRFYQMWQQENCSLEHATFDNPSGCNAKLFAWVEATVGAGTNGLSQALYAQSYYGPSFSEFFEYPAGYSANNPPTEAEWTANEYALYDSVPTTTGEGSTALGFYNVQQGDVPYFKSLADTYAMSDNFHQSVDGGTGANHIMFGHADAIWFSDGNGHPEVPPHMAGVTTNPAGYGGTGVIDQIENPNPAKGTNNWYTQDGYGSDYNTGYPSYDWTTSQPNGLPIIYGGGSYSDCSDPSAPGVGPIVAYLHSIQINPRCQPGHYYLLNNYNPGYFGQGENAYLDQNPSNTPFTIPPSSTPSIGDDLMAHNVSWKYYGDQWNNYAGNEQLNIAEDKYQLNWDYDGPTADEYCNICNPFQYDTSIMANTAIRQAHIQDSVNLYADIQNGTLPAVSIVKPSGYADGHPASSKLDIFEGFTKKIVDMIQNSGYWNDTAIFITFDEGGGYYDSGYVQPLDFFGDGTRIPLIVVSKYSTGGRISHVYSDHVSIDKFIERNWNLPPITNRSRDNFPDPVALPWNPYVPVNRPAISDLFDLFNFGQQPGQNRQ